ncbi:MAG TPA: hypothetical protein DCW90_12025 [Lachnospiraceae bacterium]|nr:hypothetical protein [Lachnospiraceae bacterium]
MATSTGWNYIQTPNSSPNDGGVVRAWVKAEITGRNGRTANVTITGKYDYSGSYIEDYDSPFTITLITPWGNEARNDSYISTEEYFSKSGTLNYDANGDLTVEFGIHIDNGWLGQTWSPWYYLYADNIGKAESAPPAPTNPSCKLSGNSNVVISWSHVGNSSSKPLTGFYIDKGEDNGVIQSGSINQNTSASQRSFTYAGAVNKRYCFRIYAYGSGGMSVGADTPNFVYTKPAAITSASEGRLYFQQSASVYDIYVKCDRSGIAWPGNAQIQLYAGGAWQSTIYTAATGSSDMVKVSSTTAVTALTTVYNSMAANATNTSLIKGRVRYANVDSSAYSDWKEFTITTYKVKVPGSIYVEAGGKAAYTYTKDSNGKITKITPNFSVNIRDDSGKGAYTYTKDSNGKITKITPNIKMSMLV